MSDPRLLSHGTLRPKLAAGLSDLVAYGEMGFSGRMPTGKAGAKAAARIAELRAIAEALAARGIQVAGRDLEDRPPPRRRGGGRV